VTAGGAAAEGGAATLFGTLSHLSHLTPLSAVNMNYKMIIQGGGGRHIVFLHKT